MRLSSDLHDRARSLAPHGVPWRQWIVRQRGVWEGTTSTRIDHPWKCQLSLRHLQGWKLQQADLNYSTDLGCVNADRWMDVADRSSTLGVVQQHAHVGRKQSKDLRVHCCYLVRIGNITVVEDGLMNVSLLMIALLKHLECSRSAT